MPLSITYRTFGIVTDVSAILVERIHFLTPYQYKIHSILITGCVGLKMSCCSDGRSVECNRNKTHLPEEEAN